MTLVTTTRSKNLTLPAFQIYSLSYQIINSICNAGTRKLCYKLLVLVTAHLLLLGIVELLSNLICANSSQRRI